MHNASDAKVCESCYGNDDSAFNPLIVLASGEEGECVHLYCARRDTKFGFCWCCQERVVYYSDDINADSECATHDGESKSDYPEEDADSDIENVRKNEGS
jgi:hypothetical protein